MDCRLAQRVLLTKLVKLDWEMCPYLTMLMVATLVLAGKTLVIAEGTWIIMMIREVFNNIFLKEPAVIMTVIGWSVGRYWD